MPGDKVDLLRLYLGTAKVSICACLLTLVVSRQPPAVAAPSQPTQSATTPTCPTAAGPYVHFEFGYIQKVGQPFPVHVSIQPPNSMPMEVHLEPGNITYSENVFPLGRGETKLVTATVKETQSGIEFVSGTALYRVNGVTKSLGENENSYVPVRTDYLGQLKPSTTDPLPYSQPTAMSFNIIYPNGKPLGLDLNNQILELTSPDAELIDTFTGTTPNAKDLHRLSLPLAARESQSELFQIQPSSRFGGNVHLTAVLRIGDDTLTMANFVFVAQPASWLLWVVAIIGGLLQAVYRIARLDSPRRRSRTIPILITSGITGYVAYLIANFDLFGLKLDPNSLRTYALLGFLISYVGVDVIAEKFSALKSRPDPE